VSPMIWSAEFRNTNRVSSRIHEALPNSPPRIYYEEFGDIRAAIAREKEVKHWDRKKRLALIATQNPTWKDLAEFLFPKRRNV
jgi:hypothetical protein